MERLPQRCLAGSRNSVALVCTSWGEAAASASRSITVCKCKHLHSLEAWARKHGQGVSKLVFRDDDATEDKKPWAGEQLLAVVQRLGHTTSGALQHLSLQAHAWFGDASELNAHLQKLSALIVLELHGRLELPHDTLHISTLTWLQRLVLGLGYLTSADIAGVGTLQQLTHLELNHLWRNVDLTTETAPWLAQLTDLRVLVLSAGVCYPEHTYGCLQPSLLAGMRQLRRLNVCKINLHDPSGSVSWAPEFLALLPQMHLTDLSLDWVETSYFPDTAAYAQVVASGRLQKLSLAKLYEPNRPDVWWRIFDPEQRSQGGRASACGPTPWPFGVC